MQTTEKILITNAIIWFFIISLTIFFAADFPIIINYYVILVTISAILSLIISWHILQRDHNSNNLTNLIDQINQLNSEQSFHKRLEITDTNELQKLAAAVNNIINTTELMQEQLERRLSQDIEHLEILAQNNKNLANTIEKNLTAKFHLTEADKKLIAAAYYEELTGLPNYLYFHELTNRIITKAIRNKTTVAVFFLDIDNFKNLISKYGQNVGNLYINHLASQLQFALRKTDLIARIGEDKFIMAIEELNSKDTIKIILDRIFIFLKNPLKTEGKKIIATSSIGVSIFPDDSRSLEKLESYADFAMYFAKKQGGNIYCYYDDIKNIVSMVS